MAISREVELRLRGCLSEIGEGHGSRFCPIVVFTLFQILQVHWERCWSEFEASIERNPGFGSNVTLREGSHDLFPAILRESDLDYRCLSSKLGILYCEESSAFLSSSEEVQVQADSVRLFLGGKSGLEVRTGYL